MRTCVRDTPKLAPMSEEVRYRAFDPFFTTRRDRGGTGLGLHIIYNLVTQRLGGRLTMESAPGRGTTFRIIISRHARHATVDLQNTSHPAGTV